LDAGKAWLLETSFTPAYGPGAVYVCRDPDGAFTAWPATPEGRLRAAVECPWADLCGLSPEPEPAKVLGEICLEAVTSLSKADARSAVAAAVEAARELGSPFEIEFALGNVMDPFNMRKKFGVPPYSTRVSWSNPRARKAAEAFEELADEVPAGHEVINSLWPSRRYWSALAADADKWEKGKAGSWSWPDLNAFKADAAMKRPGHWLGLWRG